MISTTIRAVGLLVLGAAASLPATGVPARGSIVVIAEERALEGLRLFHQTDGQEPRPVPFTVSGGAQRVLSFDCARGEYFVVSEHLISAPIRLSPSSCDSAQPVSLFSRGRIKGAISLDADGQRPRMIRLDIRTCASDPVSHVGQYSALLSGSGSFSVDVPADCLDLVLMTTGWAPTRVPRFAITLGQTVDLGRVELQRPAAISVRVEPSAAPAAVSVVPVAELSSAVEEIVKGGRTARGEVLRGNMGLYRHAALSPGFVYIVAASPGKVGFAGPLELRAGESASADVKLYDRARLQVTVSRSGPSAPPSNTLGVMLIPRIGERWFPSAAIRVEITLDDPSRVDLPFPGTWRAQLHTISDGQLTVIDDRTFVADSGKVTQLELLAQSLSFSGSVTVGKEHKPGELRLRNVVSEVSTVTAVREDGSFTIALAELGDYRAQFTAADGTVRGAVPVSCFDPATPVDIRLVPVSLKGRVVGSDGLAVAKADVFAKLAILDDLDAISSRPVRTQSDATGAFALALVDQGEWEIRAQDRERVAEPEIVAVGARDVDGVRLVLEGPATIRGRVIDTAGRPVPGARGEMFVEGSTAGQVPGVSMFRTDLQGYFSVRVDRPVNKGLHAVVVAPGRPISAFRLKNIDGQAIELRLPLLGGQLRLVLAKRATDTGALPPDLGDYLLVNADGAILSFPTLFDSQAAVVVPGPTSVTIVIPSLAPGQWRVIRFPDLRTGLLYLSGSGMAPTLLQITLAAGGSVTADVR